MTRPTYKNMQFICGKTKFFVLRSGKQDRQVGLLFTPQRRNYFLIKSVIANSQNIPVIYRKGETRESLRR